jgi:hypothetical protein
VHYKLTLQGVVSEKGCSPVLGSPLCSLLEQRAESVPAANASTIGRTCDYFDSLKARTSVLGVSGDRNACALQRPKSPFSFHFSFLGCENIEIRAPGLGIHPDDVQSSPTGEPVVHPTSRMFMQHHKM